MKKKTINTIKDILHYVLLVAGLFGLYFIGNKLLDFQGSYSLIKMFIWFVITIIPLDKLIHKILEI